jgi:hypothetical protein
LLKFRPKEGARGEQRNREERGKETSDRASDTDGGLACYFNQFAGQVQASNYPLIRISKLTRITRERAAIKCPR